LANQSYTSGITAKCGDVELHPAEGKVLVEQAEVVLCCRDFGWIAGEGETEEVGAVIDRDNDYVLIFRKAGL
jgi:hypothetical protein